MKVPLSGKKYTTALEQDLANLLYSRLCEIYDKIKKEGKVEVLGNIDFEVVEEIDDKKERIAKLKGNKILVKLSAVALPKSALRYMVAHEIAHAFMKKHTKRFWKIVKTIYPNFEVGKRLLMKNRELLYKGELI